MGGWQCFNDPICKAGISVDPTESPDSHTKFDNFFKISNIMSTNHDKTVSTYSDKKSAIKTTNNNPSNHSNCNSSWMNWNSNVGNWKKRVQSVRFSLKHVDEIIKQVDTVKLTLEITHKAPIKQDSIISLVDKHPQDEIVQIPKTETITIMKNKLTRFTGETFTKEYDNGIVFSFGKLKNENGNKNIDCSIDDLNISNHQFDIIYEPLLNKYFIKDSKQGTGCFRKVDDKLIIQNSQIYIVSFCEAHLLIQSEKIFSQWNNNILLKVSFLQGDTINKPYQFSSNITKLAKLGRSTDNEIVFQGDGVSRIHLTFVFEDKNWSCYDGYFCKKENKWIPSTNGIWNLLVGKTEIEDKMNIKTGSIMMETKLEMVK